MDRVRDLACIARSGESREPPQRSLLLVVLCVCLLICLLACLFSPFQSRRRRCSQADRVEAGHAAQALPRELDESARSRRHLTHRRPSGDSSAAAWSDQRRHRRVGRSRGRVPLDDLDRDASRLLHGDARPSGHAALDGTRRCDDLSVHDPSGASVHHELQVVRPGSRAAAGRLRILEPVLDRGSA